MCIQGSVLQAVQRRNPAVGSVQQAMVGWMDRADITLNEVGQSQGDRLGVTPPM